MNNKIILLGLATIQAIRVLPEDAMKPIEPIEPEMKEVGSLKT